MLFFFSDTSILVSHETKKSVLDRFSVRPLSFSLFFPFTRLASVPPLRVTLVDVLGGFLPLLAATVPGCLTCALRISLYELFSPSGP